MNMNEKNIRFDFFNKINEPIKEIREIVFIKEQCYIVDLDELDNNCVHILMYLDNKPIGTLRLIEKDKNSLKLGRFAILKEYRGMHLGTILLKEAEKYAKNNGYKTMYLDAQFDKRGFYFKNGYISLNKPLFLDENYPHIHLKKDL